MPDRSKERVLLICVIIALSLELIGLIFCVAVSRLHVPEVNLFKTFRLKNPIPDMSLWASTIVLAYVIWLIKNIELRRSFCNMTIILLGMNITSRFLLSLVAILQYPSVAIVGDVWWCPGIVVPIHAVSTFILLTISFLATFFKGTVKGECTISHHLLIMRLYLSAIGKIIVRYRYPFVVLYSFFIRFAPELRIWPHFVGYDTVEYAAALRDLLYYNWHPFANTWWYGGWSRLPPLLYTVLYPFVRIGVDPHIIFKIVPSVLYSLLALSIVYYTERGLLLSYGKSLLIAILSSSYYVLLGASWQLHRNILGFSLLLLTLAYIEQFFRAHSSRKTAIMLIVLSILSYLAHQMSLALLILLFMYLLVITEEKWKRLVFSILIAIGLFMLAYYAGWLQAHKISLTSAGLGGVRKASWGFSTIIASFVMYHYPLIFLAIFGYRRYLTLSALTFILLFLSISPGLCSKIGPNLDVAWRSQIMLVVPLVVYAINLLDKLKGKRLYLVSILYTLYIFIGWHYALAKNPSPIITSLFPRAFSIPSHMPSSIIPISQQEPLIKIGQWLSLRANRECPAFAVGANLYVFIHLGAGYNPNIRWILSLTDLRHKLYPQIKGIYIVAYEGTSLVKFLADYTKLVFKASPFVVLFANASSAFTLSHYIILG